MANEKQLAILKQGVEVWNKWRLEQGFSFFDFSNANLVNTDLRDANLEWADLRKANLMWADLSETNLSRASLSGTNLAGADLKKADLSKAALDGANLTGADLTSANLTEADLTNANLDEADLWGANFCQAKLVATSFTGAVFGATIVIDVDLGAAIGLENTSHWGPSFISTETIQRAQGKIPETFLRGCGLNDWEIGSARLHHPELSNEEIDNILYKMHDLRANQPLQVSRLLISYSHADSDFVDAVETKLNDRGVRFWRDIHEMKAGRVEKQIDMAIRHNPTVLVILSKNSTKSDWVEHEVRKARDLEKELCRDVLCPVTLDDAWKTARWPARIMEQLMEYNILDFSGWQDEDKFARQFRKLIDGLDIFYK